MLIKRKMEEMAEIEQARIAKVRDLGLPLPIMDTKPDHVVLYIYIYIYIYVYIDKYNRMLCTRKTSEPGSNPCALMFYDCMAAAACRCARSNGRTGVRCVNGGSTSRTALPPTSRWPNWYGQTSAIEIPSSSIPRLPRSPHNVTMTSLIIWVAMLADGREAQGGLLDQE
jgi:hypothetical protein